MDYLFKLYQPYRCHIRLPKWLDIRRPYVFEKHHVREFVLKYYSQGWCDELEIAFNKQPLTCFIAVKDHLEIVGFICYESTAKGFVGPVGVDPNYNRHGIGYALTVEALNGMRELGYLYAIGGWAIPRYFERHFGAIPIQESNGWHKNTLKK